VSRTRIREPLGNEPSLLDIALGGAGLAHGLGVLHRALARPLCSGFGVGSMSFALDAALALSRAASAFCTPLRASSMRAGHSNVQAAQSNMNLDTHF
jgi:hypothetical protein